MIEFQESGKEQSAHLSMGESFEVILHENPTAGYRWRMAEDGEPACSFTGDDFKPGRLPGAEGIHRWRFRAAQQGEGKILMKLQRSWAKEVAAAKSFALKVTVTS